MNFRWDVKAVQNLPDYMRICFLALYNTVNDLVYDTLKEHGVYILPYLTKAVSNVNNHLNLYVQIAHIKEIFSLCIYIIGSLVIN